LFLRNISFPNAKLAEDEIEQVFRAVFPAFCVRDNQSQSDTGN